MKNFNQYIIEKIKLSKDRFETKHNSFEYVDLGLPSGTLWATCNLGADEPYLPGTYYAWGELEEKEEYLEDFKNYKYADHSPNPIKFNGKKYTKEDGLINLEPEDDVVSELMKGSWHMPTLKQLKELDENVSWDLIEPDADMPAYYLGTGPNGKQIIFPITGYFSDKEIDWSDDFSLIWSNELFTKTLNAYAPGMFAGAFFLDNSNYKKNRITKIGKEYRWTGLNVRGVLNK